jgi:hypothetical protein
MFVYENDIATASYNPLHCHLSLAIDLKKSDADHDRPLRFTTRLRFNAIPNEMEAEQLQRRSGDQKNTDDANQDYRRSVCCDNLFLLAVALVILVAIGYRFFLHEKKAFFIRNA